MANKRPTRWKKARADWPGFQWRDLAVAVAGIVLAIAVLAATGRPVASLVEVAIIGGCGLAAVVFYAVGQLVWVWLQAPMYLLTEDVIAIRERVEAVPVTSAPVGPPFNMRLSLLNSIRLGEELRQHARNGGMTRKSHEEWVAPVVQLLHEHAAQEDAELFLRQRSLNEQLQVLKRFLEKYM